MTVYYCKQRRAWRSNFVMDGERHSTNLVGPDGKAVTSRRGALAAESEQKRRARIARKLPATEGLTLAQIAAQRMKLWQKEARWPNFKIYVREMLAFFGPTCAIAAIGDGRIEDYLTHLRTQPIKRWKGGPKRDPEDLRNADFWVSTGKPRSPATINLYLEPLRECLQRAARIRDPLTSTPLIPFAPDVPQLHRPKRKARPIPDDLIGEIMAAMPPHVVDAMMITLFFGFRKGEAFGLKRHDCDWARGGVVLEHDRVKDKEDAFLPGSDMAMGYLRCLDMEAEAKGTEHIITWRPYRKDVGAQALVPWRPLKDPHHAWARAQTLMIEKTGKRYRWHDLRAAFITHVAQMSGQLAAQALARHSDYQTTAMYVEAADEFRRKAAERSSDRPVLRVIK